MQVLSTLQTRLSYLNTVSWFTLHFLMQTTELELSKTSVLKAISKYSQTSE